MEVGTEIGLEQGMGKGKDSKDKGLEIEASEREAESEQMDRLQCEGEGTMEREVLFKVAKSEKL